MATENSQDLDSLLTGPDFVQDPYPVFHQLRSLAPVYWCEPWGCWLLTRYDDIMATYRDPSTFGNRGRMSALLEHLPAETWEELAPLRQHFSAGLIHVDPPDHTRLRNLVSKAFTPRVVDVIQARIAELAAALLDSVRPAGRMDVIRDFAFPLPATVVAELLGIPAADREQFRAWTREITSFQGTGRATARDALRSQKNLLAARKYFRDLFALRRREPQDDLLSGLVAAEEQGDRLSEAELVSTCTTLVLAGHETTTCLIANGLLTLLKFPGQMQRLREDPSLLTSAIEEMLRYETPLQRGFKRVAHDTEIGGQRIGEGQIVLQLLGAANRDPDHFPAPDRFDITRDAQRQIAFGYGVHFCLGAPLARLEAATAFSLLVERLPNLRLETKAPRWAGGTYFRIPEKLPVTF